MKSLLSPRLLLLLFSLIAPPHARAQDLLKLLSGKGGTTPAIALSAKEHKLKRLGEKKSKLLLELEQLQRRQPGFQEFVQREIKLTNKLLSSYRLAMQRSQWKSEPPLLQYHMLRIQAAEQYIDVLNQQSLSWASRLQNKQEFKSTLEQLIEAHTRLDAMLRRIYPPAQYTQLVARKQQLRIQKQQRENALKHTEKELALLDQHLQQEQTALDRLRRQLLRFAPLSRPTSTSRPLFSREQKKQRAALRLRNSLTAQRFTLHRSRVRLLQIRREDESIERETLQHKLQILNMTLNAIDTRQSKLSRTLEGGLLHQSNLPSWLSTFKRGVAHGRLLWRGQFIPVQQLKKKWQRQQKLMLKQTSWALWVVLFAFLLFAWWVCVRLYHVARQARQQSIDDANRATVTKALWQTVQLLLHVLYNMLPWIGFLGLPLALWYWLSSAHPWLDVALTITLWLLATRGALSLIQQLFAPAVQNQFLSTFPDRLIQQCRRLSQGIVWLTAMTAIGLALLRVMAFPKATIEGFFALYLLLALLGSQWLLFHRDIFVSLLPRQTFLERVFVWLTYQTWPWIRVFPALLFVLYLWGYRNLSFYLLKGVALSYFVLLLLFVLFNVMTATLLWLFGFATHKIGFFRDIERYRASRIVQLLRVLIFASLGLGALLFLLAAWEVPGGLQTLKRWLYMPLLQTKDVQLSTFSFAKLFVALLLLFWVIRLLPTLLQSYIFPFFNISTAWQYAVQTLLRYFLVAFGFLLALQWMGIGVSSMAMFFGLLAIGIGFGLQSIANNFISGLIILFGRPIAAGDYLEIGTLRGKVEAITIRSTTLKTPSGKRIVIPNASVVNANLINWSIGREYVRDRMEILVAYGSDIDKVSRLLLEVAKLNPDVLPRPEPRVRLRDFAEHGFRFGLSVTIEDPMTRIRILSNLRIAAYHALQGAGIEIPLPKRELSFSDESKAKLVKSLREAEQRKAAEHQDAEERKAIEALNASERSPVEKSPAGSSKLATLHETPQATAQATSTVQPTPDEAQEPGGQGEAATKRD